MKKIFVLFFLTVFFPALAMGQGTGKIPSEVIEPELSLTQEFFRAEVTEVVKDEVESTDRFTRWDRVFVVRVLDGSKKGESLEITDEGVEGLGKKLEVKANDTVVVGYIKNSDQETYFLADTYRLPVVYALVLVFLALVFAIARKKGLGSFLGLVFSVLVLVKFMLPQLVNGQNPFLIITSSVLIISSVSLFLAHGFNRQTALSLFSILITLLFAAGFAALAVYLTNISGMGTEEAIFLSISSVNKLNFQSLFLGAVLIGALGVLDDITTAQTAVVAELKKAKEELGFKELFLRSMQVGKEHIAALVNTLVLAYVSASLPLLLLLSINNQPFWVVLNSEYLVEEIIRALAGSTALVLAVPISTLLAAKYYSKRFDKI